MVGQLLTAGLVFAAAAAAATAQPEASAPRPEVLTAANDPYHRMTVPVTIRGMGPYRFLIDTGAEATVLSLSLADRLALTDRRPATLIGAASSRQVSTAAIDGLELGRRSFNVPIAPLVDAANIGGADGVLGLDSLQNQRVLLDFRRKIMRVADARQLGGNAGYEIIVKAKRKLGQLIITEALLDGVRVAVMIDTGAEGTTGNPALLRRLRHTRQIGSGTLTDINGITLDGAIRMTGQLSIGRAQISNLPVMFTDSPTFHQLGLTEEPALILGMEQLRLFNRVAIDFSTRRVLFDLQATNPFTVLHLDAG